MQNFYDSEEVRSVFYAEMEQLLLEFFPDASDALVFNHDVFDKDYEVIEQKTKTPKTPVNANYANLVHNDLNDNSGRVRCRELLTRNLRNFGREQHYTEAEADEKMSRRFMSINLAKPMETVEQNPSCCVLGLPSPISPISTTIESMTTAWAKPLGSPIDPATNGIGCHSSSPRGIHAQML